MNESSEKVAEIQTPTSEANDLTRSIAHWNDAYMVLVALTVLLAALVFIAQFVVIRKGKLLQTTQGKLISAKDAQAAIDSEGKDVKIAEATKAAGQADERSRKLQKDNLVLQATVLKLQEKMADRRLSPDQRSTVRDKMREFPPPQSWQVIVFSNDGEAKGLESDIEEALIGPNGAGWPIPYRIAEQAGIPIRGILIQFGLPLTLKRNQ